MSKELNYEEDIWNILNTAEKGCMDHVKLKRKSLQLFQGEDKLRILKVTWAKSIRHCQ